MIQCQHNEAEEYKKMSFEVFGEIVSKGRPRFTKTGRTYTPKKTLEYEQAIKMAFRSKYSYQSQKSLRIKIIAYFEIAKSHTKKNKNRMISNELQCTKKPDIDNVVKIVLDALNKVAYQDDTQVVELATLKRWSQSSKLAVYIEEIGETMNSK